MSIEIVLSYAGNEPGSVITACDIVELCRRKNLIVAYTIDEVAGGAKLTAKLAVDVQVFMAEIDRWNSA